jgi:hypothetical protein
MPRSERHSPIGHGLISAFAALLAAAVAPSAARALINPNYTPADLVRQARVILRLEVGPLDAKGGLKLQVLKALKGKAPEKLALELSASDSVLLRDFSAALGEDRKAAALVFLGDFSAAAEQGAAPGGEAPVGLLHVGSSWFALLKSSGDTLRVGLDPFEIKKVWAGGEAMLEKAVDYVQADPRAEIPTKAGVRWGRDLKVADIAGKVNGCMAVELLAPGKPCLLILAQEGDRLFQISDDGSKSVELTAKLGLATRSTCAACGDFNGDGRLDLACCDGKKISLLLMDQAGRLETKPLDVELPGACLAIAPLAAAERGRTALLVSTAGRPVLLTPGKDGRFTAQPLGEIAGASPGQAGPCLAADFDGDGICDVVQARAEGLWFYKGLRSGGFAAPSLACPVKLGDGLTTAVTGDFDADGLLDVLVGGKQGCFLLSNLGAGKFSEVLDEAGEVGYNAKPNVRGAATCDINNDGRQDFALWYEGMGPQLYFNRGFRCFGFATELDLTTSNLPAAEVAQDGQQAGAVADFNGDGAQDLAMVAAAGQVWLLLRDAAGGSNLGVTVSLPAGKPGPRNVTGFDGSRCLGAQAVSAGSSVLFGKRNKGPITLHWPGESGKRQTGRAMVLQPTRFQLSED